MKLEVRFECPFTLNDREPIEDTINVEFPIIPRIGDTISVYDKNFSVLYNKIKNVYLSNDRVIMDAVRFNVVRDVVYQDGNPTVFVGTDPNSYIVYFESPDDDQNTVFMEIKDIPHINDSILMDNLRVTGLTIAKPKVIRLSTSYINEEGSDSV